jgi:hypothetical protein
MSRDAASKRTLTQTNTFEHQAATNKTSDYVQKKMLKVSPF